MTSGWKDQEAVDGWQDSLRQLEFSQVLERVAAECETPMGAEWVKALVPLVDAAELRHRVEAVAEAARWRSQEGASLAGAGAVRAWAEMARRGGRLTGEQLWQVARTVAVAAAARRRVSSGRYPVLARAWEAVPIPEGLNAQIAAQVNEFGEVRDEASPTLYGLRRQMAALAEEIDRVLAQIVHHPDWAPYLQEPVVTIRFGRRVVPVKADFRHQVRGIVHDQSGSGQTVFVEPMEVVTRQNQWTLLARREAEEVARILDALSQAVGEAAEALAAVEATLARLDGWLAIARYGSLTQSHLVRWDGEELVLWQARHPLLERPVPIDVRLSRDKRCLVITGPNTGGKTVALKTVGLLAAMARTGLMIPAREDSVLPPLSAIWADIGDEQSLQQNLSTFSSHLRRLIPLVNAAGPETLCLVDEIGAGTDPEEGQALAEAVIERLVARRAWTVVTTHFGRLKLLAYSHPGIENGRVTFDRETLAPTYHLVIGQPGSSEALHIAARLGLDPALVERARALLHPGQLKFEAALAELARVQARLSAQEQEWEARLQALAQREAELERARAEFSAWQERARAKAQAGWQRELEALRREFQTLAETVRTAQGKEQARALEALRALVRRAEAGPAEAPPAPARSAPIAGPLQPGDWVLAPGLAMPGQVREVLGRTATVEVGGVRLKLAVADLQRAAPPVEARRTATHGGLAKRSTLPPERDLRGMTVEEALAAVDKYLDDAVLAGLSQLRVIHGKGTGALRRAVAEALAHDRRVVRYRLGEAGEGGDGATVVYLAEPSEGA